jgi:hypothetical protein
MQASGVLLAASNSIVAKMPKPTRESGGVSARGSVVATGP